MPWTTEDDGILDRGPVIAIYRPESLTWVRMGPFWWVARPIGPAVEHEYSITRYGGRTWMLKFRFIALHRGSKTSVEAARIPPWVDGLHPLDVAMELADRHYEAGDAFTVKWDELRVTRPKGAVGAP